MPDTLNERFVDPSWCGLDQPRRAPSALMTRWRALCDRARAVALGGPGSGNFGHSGRPGEIGGSGPGGDAPTGPRTDTPAFKRWFKDSKVVDADGEPLRVYHGTTHTFQQFAEAGSEHLNPESDWGAGVYFSNTSDDVAENYAGVGPDLTSRIEQRADQLESSEDLDREAALARARAELVGEGAQTVPVYLSMQEPFVVGEEDPNGGDLKETHLTMEYEYDDPNDPDSDIVGEKGTLPDFLNALRDEASQYQESEGVDDFIQQVREDGTDYISASRLTELYRKNEKVGYMTDDEGRLVSNEVFRRALERAGFDGIIDRTVDTKFGSQRRIGKQMAGMHEGTVHYIAFKPQQIKSTIGNKGTWNPDSPLMTAEGESDGPGKGNWGHAGRPGEVGGSAPNDGSSVVHSERLQKEKTAAIAHMETLLDKAVASAEFTGSAGTAEWDSLSSSEQSEAYHNFANSAYENGVDVDDSDLVNELVKDIHRDLARNSEKLIEETTENVTTAFSDDKPFDAANQQGLPLGEHGEAIERPGREIDWETVTIGEADEEGAPLEDIDKIRFTDGTEPTDAEKTLIEHTWDEKYREVYDAAFEKEREGIYDSNAYQEGHNELETQAIDNEWNNMSDSDKFEHADQDVKDRLEGGTYEPSVPNKWIIDTEVTEGSGRAVKESEAEDYDKTRILARELADIRTNEILTERGLSITGIEDLSSDVWGAWKGSSTSPLGLALQVAAADELGGHLRLDPGEEAAGRKAAEENFRRGISFIDMTPEQQQKVKDDYIKRKVDYGMVGWGKQYPELAADSQKVEEARKHQEEYYKIAWAGLSGYEQTQYAKEKGFETVESGMDRLKAYVRAQWETTQFLMDKAGKKDVELYRAIMLERSELNATRHEPATIPTSLQTFQKLPDLTIQRNGAASTTSNPDVANRWGGAGGWHKQKKDAERTVIRFKVPSTALISIPVFGQNLHNESEYVLVGTKDPWTWDAWRGTAPLFSQVPMQHHPKTIKAAAVRHLGKKLVVDLTRIDMGQPNWLNEWREQAQARVDAKNNTHPNPPTRGSLRIEGGSGSGNFGHAGRPGEVGGSAPDEGGSERSGQPSEAVTSGYTTGMEGSGPARAEWEKRNDHLMDMQDNFYTAKENHRELIAELESKHGGMEKIFEDPDYLKSKQRLVDAQTTMQQAERALKEQEPRMRREIVTNLSADVAKRLGVDPAIIRVVDKQPSEFDVGNQHFTEAGHYNPTTKQIEVNSQNSHYGDAASVKGLVAHEVSHAIYHELKQEADAEFNRYIAKAITPDGQGYTPWFHERFTQDKIGVKTARPERVQELRREFPAAAVLSKLSDGELFSGISDYMVKENGHSAYAKAYWDKEAVRARGDMYESAINETIAEMTRYLTYPKSWQEEKQPSTFSPWYHLTNDMHNWYRTRKS